MRKRILAMLRFMNIREVEQPNKGRIHIDKEALTAEVEKNGGKIVFDEEGYRKWKQEETTANQTPSIPQTIRNRNGAPRRDEDLGVSDQIQSSSHENHVKENNSSFSNESNVLNEPKVVGSPRDAVLPRNPKSNSDEKTKPHHQTSVLSYTPECAPSQDTYGVEPDRVLSESVVQRNNNNYNGYDSHHESKFYSDGEIKPQFQLSRRPPPQDSLPRPRDYGQNFKRHDRRAPGRILNGRGYQRSRSPQHSVIGEGNHKSFDHSDEPGRVYDGSHRSHIRARSRSPSLDHATDPRNRLYYAKNNRYNEQYHHSEDGTISSNEVNQNHGTSFDNDISYQGGVGHRHERTGGGRSRGYSTNDKNIVKRESIGYGQFVRNGRRGYDI